MKSITKTTKFGKFNIGHTLTDGEGIRGTNRVLTDLIEKIAENVYKLGHDNYLLPAFAYRERQFHTLMAPAILSTFKYSLMESPVNRNWSRINNRVSDVHGWVDYWCSTGDLDYYIELKHGYLAYNSTSVRVTEKEKWDEACNQLDVLIDELDNSIEYANGIFRVVFHVMPIYLSKNTKEKVTNQDVDFTDFIISRFNNFILDNGVNWWCLWELPKKLDRPYEMNKGYERYPAILYALKVYDIYKQSE